MEHDLTSIILVVTALAVVAMGVWGFRRPRRIRRPDPVPGMRLATVRLAGTERHPQALRVFDFIAKEALLFHLSRLPGLKVVAVKQGFNGGGSSGYFLYRERLFHQGGELVAGEWLPLRYVPAVYLLGPPPDEELFAEIEKHIRSCSRLMAIFGILGAMRFWFVRRDPPQDLIERYAPRSPRTSAGQDEDLPDLLTEAEVFLAAGQRKMAIELLEHASRAQPARDDIRKRLSALQAGR